MNVLKEHHGRVTVLTINRPEARNALDMETSAELTKNIHEFRDDPESWAAILTGAGDQSFCAGADLKKLRAYYASMTSEERLARSENEPGLGGLTRNLPVWKPIVAAVNGHCLAGGLELALSCDIRIAEDHATFGLTEVKWGIIPAAGGTQRLPRLIGTGKALEMILTAQRISAQEALECGLVSRVVAQGESVPAAMEVAEQICRNGPLAVRAAKEAILRGMDIPLEDGLRLEQQLAEPVRNSEDAKEGPKAFAEKRAPEFKGK